MRQQYNPTIVDKLMDEHVPMLGFPQVIVTRGFCYQWLKSQGWDMKAKGFASLDYAAFGRKATTEPLTDSDTRDYLLALIDHATTPAAVR